MRALAAKSRDEWGAIFDANGLIWGPVLALHEVAVDPHAAAIGLFPGNRTSQNTAPTAR